MNVLNGIFSWLVAASLRASLLALAVFVFQFVLGRRLPAGWRYALWLPVVLVFVAPVLPASRWSVENHLAQWTDTAPPTATASPRANVAAFVHAIASVPSTLCRCPLVAVGWLLGTVTVVSMAWVGYRRSMRRIAGEAVPTEARIASEVASAARQIRLRTLPRVIVSRAVESPAVAGWRRPMLLLPAGFPAGLSAVEARLILLHELTHLRRRDLPLNWLLCALQALHWFNPLLWFTFGRIRTDREAACDAQVLSAHAEDRRADYGHALLKVHRAVPVSGLSLAFAGVLSTRTLRARLLSIVQHRRASPAWHAVGALLVVGLVLIGVTRAPSNEEPPLADQPTSIAKGAMDERVAHAVTGLSAVLNLLTRQQESEVYSFDGGRRLYGIGSWMNGSRGWQRQTFVRPSPLRAWPGVNSARILWNANPPERRKPDQRCQSDVAMSPAGGGPDMPAALSSES